MIILTYRQIPCRRVRIDKAHFWFGDRAPHSQLWENAETQEHEAVGVYAACGETDVCPEFAEPVAVVVEPRGENPGLFVPKPLGIDLLSRIIEDVRAGRHAEGIKWPG